VNSYCNSFHLFTHSNIFDSINDRGIFYDIDTLPGQSGCPVYISGSNKLVGIHKAYCPKKNLNFAAMITESSLKILKEWTK